MAVTGGMGDVTNTFLYDAYGRLTEKVGLDDILFCYNGKYGVITEPSGLVYMRARYYSPELRRFINADVVAGEISNAITLNRYAYANGNPISNVDPLGLTAEREAQYEFMLGQLSEKDKAAGIKVVWADGAYRYDYTELVMNRLNEVLPEFKEYLILNYTEYVEQYSLKLFGKITISIPTYDEYIGFVMSSLWYFYNQVTHGAPWDIKRDGSWKEQFGDVRMPIYNSDKQEKFLFRGELVTREDLGNITYGYLGSAMGIGDITLYWGGGIAAQGFSKIFSETVRDSDQWYGDTEEDHQAIQKGIDFYYEDYPNATPGINRTFP